MLGNHLHSTLNVSAPLLILCVPEAVGRAVAALVIVDYTCCWFVARFHSLTVLSQPPEKTLLPSAFQAEHKTG